MEFKHLYVYFFFIGIVFGRIFGWIFILPKTILANFCVATLKTLIIAIFILFISFLCEKIGNNNEEAIINRFNSILFIVISVIMGYGISVILIPS